MNTEVSTSQGLRASLKFNVSILLFQNLITLLINNRNNYRYDSEIGETKRREMEGNGGKWSRPIYGLNCSRW